MMSWMKPKARRAGWAGMWLLLGTGAAWAQVDASVELGTVSTTDPHPTTYVWTAPVATITEPGTQYYHFYYTGTVNPDARVPEDVTIQRIPIPFNEWEENKRWLITQLTQYYQKTRNLPQTAVQEYQAGPVDPNALAFQPGGDLAGAPGMPGMGPGMPGMPGMGPDPGMGGFGPQAGGFGPPGMAPQPQEPEPAEDILEDDFLEDDLGMDEDLGLGGEFGTAFSSVAFDPKVAAEWTFYYDQLVLWQYYCARVLLRDAEERLLEPLPPDPRRLMRERQLSDISGLRPAEIREETTVGPLGVGRAGLAADAMGGMAGAASGFLEDDLGFGESLLGMGPLGQRGPVSALRERFSPQTDYENPDGGKRAEYLEKFEKEARWLDEQVYYQYIQMIEGIDRRALNQEHYDEWVREKRQEIYNFAETWRRVDQGETLVFDETLFLVSEDPLESLPNNTVNIIRQQRLTPQDLLNNDGTIRSGNGY